MHLGLNFYFTLSCLAYLTGKTILPDLSFFVKTFFNNFELF